MIRRQIYIESEHEALLKSLASQTGLSEAELIRRAIDQMRFQPSPRRDMRAWKKEKAFITRVIEEGPLPGERTWRREELYG
jgi:hypothetical protein